MNSRSFLISCLAAFCYASFTGCSHHYAMNSSSLSLAEILEPTKDSRMASQKAPLSFPVAVAIINVPSNTRNYGQHVPNTTLRQAAEKLKQQLLSNSKYISSVAIVSQDDIKDKISLGKIRAIYTSDVAIILSHQQDQRSNQSGVAGLMDVTVVGAFLVPGVEIKTSSVIDGKVIHIPSNAIIFRASGTDDRTSYSTSFAEKGNITEESVISILAATNDFGNSLTKTLEKFDTFDLAQALPVSSLGNDEGNISANGKPANDYWQKVDTYKSTGGGAFGALALLLSIATCFAARRRK